MEPWEAKLVAAAILLVVIFIPSVLPIKVAEIFRKRGEKGKYQLSVFACFGGGVFMGAYLMHMVPEVDHLIREALLEPNDIDFPLGELIIGLGFFILIIVDQILHIVSITVEKVGRILEERRISKASLLAERQKSATSTPVMPRKASSDDKPTTPVSPVTPVLRRKSQTTIGESGLTKSDSAPNLSSLQHKYKTNRETSVNSNISETHSKEVDKSCDAHVNNVFLFDEDMNDSKGSTPTSGFTVLPPLTVDTSKEGKSGEESTKTTIDKEKLSAMKAIVLLIALSFDGIFSGLSCGLQVDTQAVWNLMIAIMAHEMVIAFMLGLQLMKSYPAKQVFGMCTFYSTTNPIGVIIGLIITLTVNDSSQFDLISGILQACCAGVFMYVAFLEILANEYVNQATVVKTIAIILGFTLMALLVLIPSHSDPLPDISTNTTTTISP